MKIDPIRKIETHYAENDKIQRHKQNNENSKIKKGIYIQKKAHKMDSRTSNEILSQKNIEGYSTKKSKK